MIDYIIKADTKDDVLAQIAEYITLDDDNNPHLAISAREMTIKMDLLVEVSSAVYSTETGDLITAAVIRPEFFAHVRIVDVDKWDAIFEAKLGQFKTVENIGHQFA